jgi:ABC-2 type transport system ATP-binding protein
MIEVQTLTKTFGGRRVVDDLTFQVRPGRVTAFLGPNGAGKTTTLRILLGLVQGDSGTAMVNGHRYADLCDPARVVGASLENSAFHPGRTGFGHLQVLAAYAGIGRRRVREVLEEVGLTDAAGRRVGGYSLGMRQRLGLAAALLGDPPVLILDEPSNGLDPDGIRWLRSFLRAKGAEGRTVLVSSHVLREVDQTATDAVVIAGGRLRAAAPIAELVRRDGGGVQVRTVDRDGLGRALAMAGFHPQATGGDSLAVPDATSADVGAVAARHGIAVLEMSAGADLEHVFFALTGSH